MGNWTRRLGGFFGFATLAVLVFYFLCLRFPGRSPNTGYADSGLFGWVVSFLLMGAIGCLFGAFDTPKDTPK